MTHRTLKSMMKYMFSVIIAAFICMAGCNTDTSPDEIDVTRWLNITSAGELGRTVFVYDDNIYKIGTTSQYAKIESNGTIGTIGPWSDTTALSPSRELFSGFSYNGYLYILGGFSDVIGVDLGKTVEYSKINSVINKQAKDKLSNILVVIMI